MYPLQLAFESPAVPASALTGARTSVRLIAVSFVVAMIHIAVVRYVFPIGRCEARIPANTQAVHEASVDCLHRRCGVFYCCNNKSL
jgi:hypothetical protein